MQTFLEILHRDQLDTVPFTSQLYEDYKVLKSIDRRGDLIDLRFYEQR